MSHYIVLLVSLSYSSSNFHFTVSDVVVQFVNKISTTGISAADLEGIFAIIVADLYTHPNAPQGTVQHSPNKTNTRMGGEYSIESTHDNFLSDMYTLLLKCPASIFIQLY